MVLQNEILTVQEVAVYLRVNKVTVWRWCQEGTISAFRIGHGWRIYRQDLLRLLDPESSLSATLIDATHDTEE